MALIDCPECGRQVSTGASACPGCGVDHPAELAAQRYDAALSSARLRATTRASFEAFAVALGSALPIALVAKLFGESPEDLIGLAFLIALGFFVVRRSRLVRRHLKQSK